MEATLDLGSSAERRRGSTPLSRTTIYIRDRNMLYYGEEMIDMLKKFKKHALKLLYAYHYHVSNYYYKKVDAYGPENNDYWESKVVKHTNKEFELVEKLIQLEGI